MNRSCSNWIAFMKSYFDIPICMPSARQVSINKPPFPSPTFRYSLKLGSSSWIRTKLINRNITLFQDSPEHNHPTMPKNICLSQKHPVKVSDKSHSSITSRLRTPQSINSHRSPIRNSSSCSGSTNGGSTTGPKLYANIMPSLKV